MSIFNKLNPLIDKVSGKIGLSIDIDARQGRIELSVFNGNDSFEIIRRLSPTEYFNLGFELEEVIKEMESVLREVKGQGGT